MKREFIASILLAIMTADFRIETIKTKEHQNFVWGKNGQYIILYPAKNVLQNEGRNKCISRESNMLFVAFPPYSG